MNPYLFFDGQCEAAFKFYERCLGGKIEAMIPHEGSPAADHVPAEWRAKILHARMVVGDQVLMASDAPPGRQEKPQGFSINLGLKDPAEAERVFKALAEGGSVTMPFGETFWATRFGMLVDRFGIPWMVNCEKVAEKAA
jgi:PhnB protein